MVDGPHNAHSLYLLLQLDAQTPQQRLRADPDIICRTTPHLTGGTRRTTEEVLMLMKKDVGFDDAEENPEQQGKQQLANAE